MDNILLYILTALVAVLIVVVIVMVTKFDALKKEVWEASQQAAGNNAAMQSNIQSALTDTVAKSYANLNRSIEAVYKEIGEIQSVADGVGDLKKILSNVKSRGILGEIQLGNILSNVLAPGQYEENIATVPGSRNRVEYAVKLPGGDDGPVWLPVDSKFPGDAYGHLVDAYESGNAAAVDETKKILVQMFRNEAKDIASKYIQPPYTCDFGIMFLPFEGLYAEAVGMGMIELLQREFNVMLAGPSTMAAMLSSLQMGFKTLAIQKNADEAWRVMSAVKSEFDSFEAVLNDARTRLKQADDELDKLVGVRTRQIQRALKDVQTLEYKD